MSGCICRLHVGGEGVQEREPEGEGSRGLEHEETDIGMMTDYMNEGDYERDVFGDE